MANRIDALLSGLGRLGAVCEASLENDDIPPIRVDAIRRASSELTRMLEHPLEKRIAIALACAVINADVERRGLVLQVNDDCWVDMELYSSEQTRKTMAALMFD